jgi:transposase
MKEHNDEMGDWGAGAQLRVGLDIGERRCHWHATNLAGGEIQSGWLATKREVIREAFAQLPAGVIALEAGSHSRWMWQELTQLGHWAVVLRPDVLRQGKRRKRRNDPKDAAELSEKARLAAEGRLQGQWQRTDANQQELTRVNCRETTVEVRSKVINAVRGSVKPHGERIGRHSAESFARFARKELSAEVLALVEPLLQVCEAATAALKEYDAAMAAELAKDPEAERLSQVKGVGPVGQAVYHAVVGPKERIKKSRDAAALAGLVPGLDESGEDEGTTRISKAGNAMLRRVMVQDAHYIMGPHGPDSALRRWALKLAGDGKSKRQWKRAVVALARKLMVLLHRLWVTGEAYEPMRGVKCDEAVEAAA